MEWFLDHWTEIAGVFAALLLTFDRLAKLTPTKRDDGAVSNLYRLFAILGVKVPDRQGKGDA